MDEIQLRLLLEKYHNGTCTREERVLLESWYMTEAKSRKPETENIPMYDFESLIWNDIKQQTGVKYNLQKTRSARLWPRFAAAASIILGLSIGSYLLLRKNEPRQIAQNQQLGIEPGGNKAILTLSNGQKISLSDAKNGNIAQQSGTQIKKAQNGQVVYLVSGLAANGGNSTEVAYNTISTPRGGQWQLTLPDGSHVWLNAASSITFPTAFTGNDRRVKITGEAYFEVIHNAANPFRVNVKGQTIEDIGTHFDINAYDDEANIKTTLLEGSVKISNKVASVILKPGQEATFINQQYQVGTADEEQAIAWKNGLIRFDNMDVHALMRQVARWYNVDIAYEGKVTGHAFTGEIRRSTGLSNVLQILEQGGIHCQVAGRKITITP